MTETMTYRCIRAKCFKAGRQTELDMCVRGEQNTVARSERQARIASKSQVASHQFLLVDSRAYGRALVCDRFCLCFYLFAGDFLALGLVTFVSWKYLM